MRDIDVYAFRMCREPVSSLSHFIGAVVFSAMTVFLLRRGRGDWGRVLSLTILAATTVLLLVLSGLYHVLWPGEARQLLSRADVSAVFLLIAGSLTPVQFILFRGPSRWIPLAIMWMVALIGICMRMLYFETLSGEVGIALFLAMGWGGAITPVVLCDRYGWNFVRLGVLSGLSYTLGAMILALHRPTVVAGLIGPHELWHLAVLIGLGLHWAFVFQFASGQLPAERRLQRQHLASP